MVKIPNLVRKEIGWVDEDFSIHESINGLAPPETRRRQGYNNKFNSQVFGGRYSYNDAIYRQNFLSDWLDREVRPKLNRLFYGIPGERIYSVSYEEDFDGFNDQAEERALRQIGLVERRILIPKTLEAAAELPGSSNAVRELRKFADRTRRELNHFVRITAPFLKDPRFTNSEDIEEKVKWANDVLEKTRYMDPLFEELIDLKRELRHFIDLAEPYEVEFQGKRVPSCKPELLEPERREGKIINAYNPTYFKWRITKEGRRRKVEIKKLNIPNNIFWGSEARGTYIHGPNSMGKSVYISTAALNIHLAMNGAYCFADSARLSLPRQLFPCLDLGSSLNEGHFGNGGERVRYMLKRVKEEDIIFMDEVGSGTEPEAEREVAKGLSDSLLAHGLTFFSVTHDKGSWLHNKNKKGVRILRVADYNDWRKKFKVWEGIAPNGYGLEKAKRLGIDPESVRRTLDKRLN